MQKILWISVEGYAVDIKKALRFGELNESG